MEQMQKVVRGDYTGVIITETSTRRKENISKAKDQWFTHKEMENKYGEAVLKATVEAQTVTMERDPDVPDAVPFPQNQKYYQVKKQGIAQTTNMEEVSAASSCVAEPEVANGLKEAVSS